MYDDCEGDGWQMVPDHVPVQKPFNAPVEPGPEQRVTPMPDVATALIDTIQVAGDQADLEAHHDTLRMGAAMSSFKMKIGETGEVFTVTVTRGWAGR